METIENKLISEARGLNACDLLKDGLAALDLVKLAFTPQGQEFCANKGFPGVDDLTALEAAIGGNNATYSIVVNRRVYVRPNNTRNFAFAGPECEAEIVCGEADKTYTILVFHGAKVTIHALGYAVIRVVEIGEGTKVNFLKYEKAVRL